ncbi:MAG: hypothetical protein OJF50_005937 [Nitrospira sp.]|jgi:hypothetical protein|nr:hypothetical protein [Nitrospira sp.]
MACVFISYRRDDAEGYAGRLRDELKRHLGDDSVFLDVEGIGPGLSFREVIQAQLTCCDIMLVVIGKGWMEIKDKSGKRRLDYQDDFVRLEIGTALKRGIPVVPILVQGTTLPLESELPDDLKPLAERQAYVLRHDSWDSDVGRLVARLSTMVPSIVEAIRTQSHLTEALSFNEASETPSIFTKASFLAWLGSIILIGVVYQIFYLMLDLHHSVLFLMWLGIGLLMGKWHATHAMVNVVRDVLLGCAISLGGAIVMSLDGALFYKQPFWPQNIPEWQYTAMHMTTIMVSFVAGGALPLFMEKGRTWEKLKFRLIGKA